MPEIKDYLEKTGLKLACLIPDLFSTREWVKGSFCSKDAAIRRKAIAYTKTMMDIAAELGCERINLWLGQDGFDYPFQADYLQERQWLIEGIRECAKYRGDIKLCLEYKPKEPRTHSYIGNVSTALLMVKEIGLDNVGVTIDTGHALNSYEDLGDSVAMLKLHGNRLFHLHLNDNYRLWDDDMIVGSVHTIEFLEFFFWLARTGYDGWYSMDLYPYREDGAKAVTESITWIQEFYSLLDRIEAEAIEEVIQSGDATAALALLRSNFFGSGVSK